MPRSESPRGTKRPGGPRFELDPIWLRRGALALAVIAFIVVLAKASIMMFSGGNKRLERQERAAQEPASAEPAKPSAPR